MSTFYNFDSGCCGNFFYNGLSIRTVFAPVNLFLVTLFKLFFSKKYIMVLTDEESESNTKVD